MVNRRMVTATAAMAILILGAFVATNPSDDSEVVADRLAPGLDASLPPGKQLEVASAHDQEGELAVPSYAELEEPFPDSGNAGTVATVKQVTPELLTADRATFRAPFDESEIAERLDEPLKSTWSDVAQAAQYQEKYDALRSILNDPAYRTYSNNRFTVVEWQGVSIDGRAAFALLKGRDEYFDSGGWESDPDRQWQIRLRNDNADNSGAWRLMEVSGVDYEAP